MASRERADRPQTERASPIGRRLGYLLKHANLRFSALSTSALAPFGIDGREWAALVSLHDEDPLSQREGARRLGIDRTTMVALVDELESKGLVERRPHPDDRRKNIVALTAKGRETLVRAARAVGKAEQRFFEPLSQADVLRFKNILRRLVFQEGDDS
jgi:DNA-binding MarR family transcriptional regulator